MSHRSLTAVASAALAALLVAGCATPPPAKPLPRYVAPTSGATAKLVMRGDVRGGVYGVVAYDDAENCTGLRMVGTGSVGRNPPSTTLAADRLTTLAYMFVRNEPKQACVVRWSFKPMPGKTYLVSGTAGETGCGSARLIDATDPDQMREEPSALRRNVAANACVPLAQSKSVVAAAKAGGEVNGEAVLRPGATSDELGGLIGQ